ncbi:MAG: hypothetical protein H7X80_05700 [bacterium]|nr:hypothetical protein [Candidatus Kapabacteria bacterium]
MKTFQSTIARIACASLAIACAVTAAHAQEIPAATLAKYDSLSATLKPATRSWVFEQAAKSKLVAGTAAATESSMRAAIASRFPAGAASDADRKALLYLVMRESIKQMQEDKKFYLAKLNAHNEAAKALSDELVELTAASASLAAAEKGPEEDNAPCTLPACVQFKAKYDAILAKRRASGLPSKPLAAIRTRGDLSQRMRELEAQQEEIRNKRTQDQTAFQNFDQKTNQLMNMLSSIVKEMADMRSIGKSNRTGL